ncbi:MAG: hypothetical protein AAFZ63_15785 [Bacteroidota bacterium]
MTELPAPSEIQLTSIELSFIDNIPVYKDTDAFLRAKKAAANASHQQYLEWARARGFASLYVRYNELAEQVDNNPDVLAASQIAFSQEDLFYTTEEGGVFLKPTIPFAKLLDQEARMFIGDDLHGFTETLHVIIANGSPEQLERVLEKPVHDPENGIIIEYALSNKVGTKSTNLKVAYDLVTCPFIFVENDDPLRTVPENIQIINKAEWSPGNYQALRHKYEQQEVGCSKRKCRQGTKGYLIGLSMISEITPTGYRMISSLEHKYENRRRSGLNWVRTFPDVRFERDPTRFPLEVEYNTGVSGLAIPTSLPLYVSTETVSYPTTEEEIAPHNSSAHGGWTLTEKNLVVETTLSGVFYAFIKFEDGRTRHRWINRGDDPIDDPVAVTFGCSG